jgi:hypothetical protein
MCESESSNSTAHDPELNPLPTKSKTLNSPKILSICIKFQMATCSRFTHNTFVGIFYPPQSDLHVQPILYSRFYKCKNR